MECILNSLICLSLLSTTIFTYHLPNYAADSLTFCVEDYNLPDYLISGSRVYFSPVGGNGTWTLVKENYGTRGQLIIDTLETSIPGTYEWRVVKGVTVKTESRNCNPVRTVGIAPVSVPYVSDKETIYLDIMGRRVKNFPYVPSGVYIELSKKRGIKIIRIK